MRTKLGILVVAGALLALGVGAPAHGGNGPVVNIEKVVEGTPRPGTEFVVEYECAPINGTEEAEQPETQGQVAGELVFGETGGIQQVNIPFDVDCTFEETGDGGASQTLLVVDCQAGQNCQQTGPNTVVFLLDSLGQPEATFTFTNVYEPEPPSAPLPVEPTFTG